MSVNWANIGANLGTLNTTLTSLGLTPANITTVLNQVGSLSNPNQSDELAICQALMINAGNPVLVAAYEQKLIMEVGLPPAAASIASTLANAGVDVDAKVLEIEQIIKNGG